MSGTPGSNFVRRPCFNPLTLYRLNVCPVLPPPFASLGMASEREREASAREEGAALTPPTNEVFIGALPRQTRLQAAMATGLHDALLQFAGTTDRASVQLRMHSSSDGRGLGIAFAWLPDEATAQRLVDATELYFELNGKRVRAGIRAARGRADARAPPSSEPGSVSIAVFAP